MYLLEGWCYDWKVICKGMQETWKMVVINIVIIIKKFEYNRVEYI